MSLSFNELIEYTDWERARWYDWLLKRGDDVLTTSAGPNGDGRFQSVGDVLRRIFRPRSVTSTGFRTAL
jgi:hypothetical protein